MNDEPVDLAAKRANKRKSTPEKRMPDEFWELRELLDKNEKGSVLPTHSNLMRILKADQQIAGCARYNAFTGRHELTRAFPVIGPQMGAAPGEYPRARTDDDIVRLLIYLQTTWCNGFKRTTVDECVSVDGTDSHYHPVCDWLDTLEWDTTQRIEQWLVRVFGCENDTYHRAVAAKLLIAAVRRVREPGCKFDHMPVLEGAQGIGKSRAISVLFGVEWTTDQISDLSKKDAAIDLQGKWGIELSEIEHVIRSDVETVKAFLSRSNDHYRAPYGRISMDVPRQCVLIGSTNASEYLRDETGNRRIWPVKCRSVDAADVEWLIANRDQLWAEASVVEARKEPIWIEDAGVVSEAQKVQAERLESDVWDDKVFEHLNLHATANMRIPEILHNVLGIEHGHQEKRMEMRVAKILKRAGWSRDTGRDKATGLPVKHWKRDE